MSISKNFCTTFLSQILNLILTFGITTLMIKKMGAERYGEYSYYYLIITILISYTDLGIIKSTLNILKRNSDKYNREVIKTNLSFINMLLLSLSSVGVVLFNYKSEVNFVRFILIIVSIYFGMSFELFQRKLIFENNLSLLNKSKNISNVLKALMFLILLLLDIKNINMYFLVIALFFFIRFYIANSQKIYKLDLKLNFKILKKEFNLGYLIFLSTLFSTLNLRADQFIIEKFLGMFELGIYSGISQIAESINLISSSISLAILGHLYKIEKSSKIIDKTIKITFLSLSIISLVGIFFSKYIGFIFGSEYLRAIKPLQILLIGSIFQGIRMIIDSYFYRINKIKKNLIANAIGALTNIALNYIFIQKYNLIGVAIASLISYFLSFCILIIFYKIEVKNEEI